MNFYHFNQRRISGAGAPSNNLMNDKRAKMKEYSDNILYKNMGITRPFSNLSKNSNHDFYNISNISKKTSANRDYINYQKINEKKYDFQHDYKEDYFKHKTNNPFKNYNGLKLTNNTLKTKSDTNYENYNFNQRRESTGYDKNYSLFGDVGHLNSKTEILKHKISDIEEKKEKGYFDIENNYIRNYLPNLDRINKTNYNKENLLKKEFDEYKKDNKRNSNYNNEKNDQENNDILAKYKLTNKYLYDEQRIVGDEIVDYKNKLYNFNIEKNKIINNNENKIEHEEKKDNDIKYRENSRFLENIGSKNKEENNKSNINRSKSVAPNKNAISEISKISNSLIGFNNLGATCYMNSALQNIIHCKCFINKIRAFQNSNIMDKSITNSFINLCNSLIDSKNKETRRYYSYTSSLNSFSPSDFKSNFCLKHKDYMRGQHDSIEFLRTLLDDMSKEMNINQNISAYKELTTEGKSKEEQSKEYHNFFKSRENSIIGDIFYNQIINIFTCVCGFESYSFQKLLDIPLLLPNKGLRISLSSLIKEYFKEEELEWSSKCENCKKPDLKHLKITKFCILNEIVIFSLQRFDPVLSIKNNIRVSFDEVIDLKDYCDIDLYKENTKYRLLGTINHIGNINYGHYYAYIRIGENWYEFNDSIVNKAYKMDYDNSSVCVLFYEKL